MFRLLFVSALVACCLGATVPLQKGKGDRIVGGYDTKIEHFPYQVSLVINGIHNCGGSLIAKNWVLTAAHCIKKQFYIVRAGSTEKDAGGVIYKVKNQYVHPEYRGVDYDFALLELQQDVTLSDKVQLIKLVDQGIELPLGTALNVTGWGSTGPKAKPTKILQAVSVPTIRQDDCSLAYGPSLTNRMFCAGYLGIGGKDACQGDSGGPVVADGIQYGVVSFGRGCAEPDFPGVYSKISNQRQWIKEVSGV